MNQVNRQSNQYDFCLECLVILHLRIFANMFQTIYFTYVECYSGIDNNIRECHHKTKQIMEDVNDDELFLIPSGVVLEVNDREDFFIKLSGI